MFRLQRYFSVASAIAIIFLTIVLALIYRQNAIGTLVGLIETQNAALSQSFANVIRPRYMNYVREVSALKLDGETLRGRPETAALHATFDDLTKGLPVLKVKIYSIDGLTVYSSEFAQIGEIKKIAGGFGATLEHGKPVTAISHRESFTAFSGVVRDRHLTESYLPIFGAEDGKLQWVFELYADVTTQVEDIAAATTRMVVHLLLGLGLLYAVLFLIVRHADGIMKSQYLDLSREIGDRRVAERNYLEARDEAEAATRAKSEFLAHMSHELRTPLNSILGFSEAMEVETHGPIGNRKYQEYVQDIQRSGKHLLRLINDVLDISKIEAGEMRINEEDIDLPATLAECVRVIEGWREAAAVTIALETEADLPKLRADERLVRQITLNLMSNAIKFNKEGGDVRLSCQLTDAGSMSIVVGDTGLGIAKKDLAMVLEPFGQVRGNSLETHEGTGLGLSLSKQLVELHGGRLDIDSSPGVGTTVSVIFPPDRTVDIGKAA